MQVIVENNLTHFKRYYPNIHILNSTPLYKAIQLNVSELVDGEYTLILLNNANQIIQKELLKVGDYTIKEYKIDKKYTTYAR